MGFSKKLDPAVSKVLRSWFSQINISKKKVTIDLENETFEVEEEYKMEHIWKSFGVLTQEEGKALEEEIRQMREEDWD
jgi:hypothetical protein